jgi:hypothetical protein
MKNLTSVTWIFGKGALFLLLREILRLYDKPYTTPQIAEEVGVPVTVVRRTLLRNGSDGEIRK